MKIVFRFWAPDPNMQGYMVADSIDAAIAHVCNVLNGPNVVEGRKWTIDEEGEELPDADWLRSQLEYRLPVTLHDQSSIGTLETVEISPAWGG